MPAGRPPLFDSVDELQEKIDDYFESGVKRKTYVCGPANARYDVTIDVPTITGLCNYLGFESRQSFYEYEQKPEFTYTIKKARLMIEQHYEENLQFGNTPGSIFALKNFGWTDKQEIDQKTTIEDNRIDASKLSDDELRTLAEIQRKSRTSEKES